MTERKIALVTGGSRGIGLACALELAKAGCDIIINDICDAEKAQPAIDEIKACGVNAYFYSFDVSNDEAVKENVDRSGNSTFNISSKNLIELTGPIGKIMYDEFSFEMWGGKILHDGGKNQIWFNPKFHFKYKDGGSNGSDAFWSGIWYNIDEDE